MMTIRQYFAVAFLLSTFSVLGCSPQEKIQDKGEKPASGVPKSPTLQTSSWGEWHNGLQCRVTVRKEIEQGMPLEAPVEFNCEAAEVPEGARKLNRFLHSAYLKLVMKNTSTGQISEIRPYDPTQGMLAVDDGEHTAPLDGSRIEPWKTTFPLVRARDGLVPGMYECRVEFTYSWERRVIGWQGTKAEWESAGFWTGTITSGPFTLKILKETPKTKEYWLPKRLRINKRLEVRFRKEDAQKVALPMRNGFFVAAKYYRDGKFFCLTGLPVPDDANYIDYWYDYKGEDRDVTYTIEIFETSDPPVHMWSPGPRSGNYKVLWKKSFKVLVMSLK
jgi:hypothetical protein